MVDLAPIDIEGTATPAPAAPEPGPGDVQGYATEPGHIALVDQDGQVMSVPNENAQEAVRQYGYRPATDTELYTAQTGTAGTAAATLDGALRGATFGLTDPLQVEIGRALGGDAAAESIRSQGRMLQEGHETASTVGEIGGSLATLALAPEAGFEKGGAMLFGGEGALARAAGRAVVAAPRLFAEGAAMGAGHQLTEDTLGDHELVAGKYVSAGLEGGLINMILGAGLTAGAGAIGDKLAARAAAKAAEGGATAETKAVKGTLDKLQGLAEEQAAKGAMPPSGLSTPELLKLGRTAEEQAARTREIGRTLLDEGITTPGATKAVQAERLTKRVADVGEELGGIRKSLEKSAIRPSAENVRNRILEEVVFPALERPFSSGDQAAIKPFVNDIDKVLGTKSTFDKFDDLFQLRRALDEKLSAMRVYEKFNGAAPGHADLKAIRGILESEFESAAARAADDLGTDVASKYKATKALFSDLKTAEKWATKGAAREAQNRAVSLTDTIMGGAAIAAGHPIGVLAPVGNKLMRTYGNQAAAFALDRVAKLASIQKAAELFDGKLNASVKAFFGHAKPPESPAPRPALSPAQRAQLRAAITNPAALTEHVADATAKTGLRDAAPNITGALAGMTMRAATYLQQRMPREPSPIGVSFGQKEPRALGPKAQAELDRAVDALDANKTLDDLAHNRLSREQVEAIKFINPPLFAQIQSAVRRYGMENDPDISIQKEIAMSIVFDTPMSSYTKPSTIKGFQQAFAQGLPADQQQPSGPQPQPIGNGDSKRAAALTSPMEKMLSDE